MISIKLEDLIPVTEHVDAYLKYRFIEEWCIENVPKGRWKFDYSSTLCVCGIDVPGRIFFWTDEDAVTFKLAIGSSCP